MVDAETPRRRDAGTRGRAADRPRGRWGNVMFVAGQGVNGGAYYVTEWKPLTDDLEADLHVTTDYRQVLAEIVAARFPAAPRSTVFPGLAPYQPLGFMAGT
jgi:hypothetical protein